MLSLFKLSLIISVVVLNVNVALGAGGGGGGSHNVVAVAVTGKNNSWSDHVYYKPKNLILKEGRTLRITCILTIFDQLKWTHNGSQINFKKKYLNNEMGYPSSQVEKFQQFLKSSLTIVNAQKEHSGDYQCTAYSPLSVAVTVISDPGNENTKMLHPGYPLAIECKIQKEKEDKLVNVKWFKDNEQILSDDDRYKTTDSNSSLIVAASAREDVGVYRCNDAAGDQYEVSVIYLAYKKMPKSVTVLQGGRLSLSCEAEGDPVPAITWFKDNIDVKEAVNETHFALEANEKGTPNATFVIPNAEYDDRAEYACLINVASVRYNTTTFVRVKDMYAALWPFLGICAEVFILCLIIFIYEKKRAKADFEESDTDQPTDGKNMCDPNKDDSVRQRK